MANWFVRSSSAGSNNGTDWSNAWDFTTLNASWASVNPGDTIWLAGGTYAAGIEFTKSGTALNYIYVKRATTLDAAATGASGWDPDFDSQVIIGPTTDTCPMVWPNSDGTGSYVNIDGRTHNGIKCKYDNSVDAFLGAVVPGGGQHDVFCSYLDMSGPGTGGYGNPVGFNYAGDNAPFEMRGTVPVYNFTFSHCDMHSGVNCVYSSGNSANHHLTFEYCRFYDNVSSGFLHANIMYNEQGHDWIIRYCDFSGWQVEGILMFNVGASAVFEIYGNVFHDPDNTSVTTCFWPGSNVDETDVQAALSLYNNTFIGVAVTSNQSRSWPFGPASIARNNIYWDASFGNLSVIADSDYNFSDVSGNGKGGAHSITDGVNPFSSGTDFHITGYTGANRPRNNGVALASPYDTDFGGNPRGADGNWDMGAYEYLVVPGKVTRGVPIL